MDIKIWMMTGTSKSPKIIPIHSVLETNLPINPPPVITNLPSGACRMSSVAKKKAKSSLFSGKERKLGKLEGRGTLRFSITLLIGCTDFFFRVPDFIDCTISIKNDKSLNLDNLKATHEEADTRMIRHMLHCKNVSNCRTIAVSATDTDVFLVLLHHAYGMDIKIWMMAGTSKSPKIIPIHSALETNLPTRRMAQNVLAFHSITG
jgi:hypothetical protein